MAAGLHRSEKNIARNQYRHPAETLTFFGLENDMSVIEISPGGMWYTEVLAPLLKDNGQLIAASYDLDLPDQPEYQSRQTQAIMKKIADFPKEYGAINIVKFSPPEVIQLGAKDSVDMVLTFRNTHGWMRGGSAELVYQSFFEVLKSGGVLGVVQHRGDRLLPSGNISGYVPESTMIKLIESAGFIFEEKAEINANARDGKDYRIGVWTLPPALRLKEENRSEYLAIGESDRMTLRFRKP